MALMLMLTLLEEEDEVIMVWGEPEEDVSRV